MKVVVVEGNLRTINGSQLIHWWRVIKRDGDRDTARVDRFKVVTYLILIYGETNWKFGPYRSKWI